MIALLAGCDLDGNQHQAAATPRALERSRQTAPADISRAHVAQPDRSPITDRMELAKADVEPLTFRVEYGHSRGPCIAGPDGSWAMPVLDEFEVVNKVSGDSRSRISSIVVRFMTNMGAAYPKNLAVGDELFVRLTPTRGTWKQVEAGGQVVAIDGDEIERIEPTDAAHLEKP
jgi:hypothetical protein